MISSLTPHFLNTSLRKGKSYWIFYTARRRLSEKEPFIWFFGQEWYLFVEDGVFRCPTRFSPIPFRPLGLWAFVDTDNTSTSDCTTLGVPAEISEFMGGLHIIFVTSPRQERWKGLKKVTSCKTLVMDPWSWDEIYRA